MGVFIAPKLGNEDGRNTTTLSVVPHVDLLGHFGVGYSAEVWNGQREGLVFFEERRLVLTWRLR